MKPTPDQQLNNIKQWAKALGFNDLAITDVDLGEHEAHLLSWLDKHYQGEMDYMQRHGVKRSRPNELEPGTLRVISVRMDYFPPQAQSIREVMNNPSLGLISRYATGRDYHKLIRKRLQKLVDKMQQAFGPFGHRVFTDSAPVLEKALAENAGLGWIGKHTNLINRNAGSWFFLGEIYTDLPLATDNSKSDNHCGSCQACIDICPTEAIVAPYQLDARRCISYLTIELKTAIPVEFRKAIGNRIYGCDDCQLVCPWNRFSKPSDEKDFNVRHGLDAPELIELFSWEEEEFLRKMEGSAIRRIGYQQWIRNIAVAIGNIQPENTQHYQQLTETLNEKRPAMPPLVQEHIDWALDSLKANQPIKG